MTRFRLALLGFSTVGLLVLVSSVFCCPTCKGTSPNKYCGSYCCNTSGVCY